jgi:hypothetical protein
LAGINVRQFGARQFPVSFQRQVRESRSAQPRAKDSNRTNKIIVRGEKNADAPLLAGQLAQERLIDGVIYDDHFAPIDRSFRGERERICDVKRTPRRLVEDLIDLDIDRGARRLKPTFDRFERKMNLRLFKPGYETEGGGGSAL